MEWDVSNVTDLSYIFYNCKKLNINRNLKYGMFKM